MGRVSITENDEDFRSKLHQTAEKSSNAVIIVYFYADWCGPCKSIAPEYERLSEEHANATFIKANVDKCPLAAQTHSVEVIPTFVFYRGSNKVQTLTGVTPSILDEKIRTLVSQSGSAGKPQYNGAMELTSFIDKSNMECLNCVNTNTLEFLFNDTAGFVVSDADEQLIFYFAFSQIIKLQSIIFKAPSDRGPSKIKIYINQTSTPDFDACMNTNGVQEFKLTPEDLEGNPVNLNYVKFQKVNSITIFVENNQENGELTQIDQLIFLGSPVSTTNMNEFKRIAGKKGEAHG